MKLFVAVMGASNYIFAQARASEKIADWIGAHVDLFAFLGGVPKFVICDNLKAAVTNPDHYEPGLNRSYLELADHDGAVIFRRGPTNRAIRRKRNNRFYWQSEGSRQAPQSSLLQRRRPQRGDRRPRARHQRSPDEGF